MSRELQAKRTVNFAQAIDLGNGAKEYRYEEQIEGRAGAQNGTVVVPTWRARDVTREIDLVEEVARAEAVTPGERVVDVLRRGLQQLLETPEADSIRAVELVKQHPGKMWVLDELGRLMRHMDA